MSSEFKNSVIENKKKIALNKKRRLNKILLRNKFLGEWASGILNLKFSKKKDYIIKVSNMDLEGTNSKAVVKKIEKDFIRRKINISYREIEFKVYDFDIEANVILENKLKINDLK